MQAFTMKSGLTRNLTFRLMEISTMFYVCTYIDFTEVNDFHKCTYWYFLMCIIFLILHLLKQVMSVKVMTVQLTIKPRSQPAQMLNKSIRGYWPFACTYNKTERQCESIDSLTQKCVTSWTKWLTFTWFCMWGDMLLS